MVVRIWLTPLRQGWIKMSVIVIFLNLLETHDLNTGGKQEFDEWYEIYQNSKGNEGSQSHIRCPFQDFFQHQCAAEAPVQHFEGAVSVELQVGHQEVICQDVVGHQSEVQGGLRKWERNWSRLFSMCPFIPLLPNPPFY